MHQTVGQDRKLMKSLPQKQEGNVDREDGDQVSREVLPTSCTLGGLPVSGLYKASRIGGTTRGNASPALTQNNFQVELDVSSPVATCHTPMQLQNNTLTCA